MSLNLLKKISPQTVCPDRLQRLDIPGAPKEVVLYDLFGIVTGYKTSKPGSEREWIKFTGEFEAVDTATGVISNSGSAFVHQPMQDMLFSRLCQAKEEDPNASVKFAIRASIVAPKPGRPSITGYEFKVQSIVEQDKVSPLADLREQAKAVLLQLESKPAPAPVTEISSKKK